jgi:glycosyltransferase involved in cell wall biosynthesis
VSSLSKEDVEVSIICGGVVFSRVKLNDSVTVVTVPSSLIAPRLSFTLSVTRRASVILSLVKQADVVHFFSSIGPLAGWIKKKTKKPVVSSLHGVPLRNLKGFLSSPLSGWTFGDVASDLLEYPLSHVFVKKTLSDSDHIIVPSFHTLEDILASYNIPIDEFSVIPNGVDFNMPFFQSSASSEERDESDSICYCGRLTWVKGVTFLIKAFSILADKVDDVNLKIIGRGPMGSHLKKIVSDASIGNVHFLGNVSREKAIQEMRNSSFFVLPSLNENGPVVAYEAMALGKPVVAFDFSFAREFIRNNYNGLLAKPFDVEDLSDKMLTLSTAKDITAKLGKNAYAYAIKNHNWSTNVKKYMSIYRKLAELQ